MNEFIEIEFKKPNGQRLRVKRQLNGGIEFDEPDPIERTVGIQINARGDATKERMKRIEKVKGWGPGGFRLLPTVEDGNIVLRGVDQDALPEGLYAVRVQMEEAKTKAISPNADVKHDGHDLVTFEVHRDERDVTVDLSAVDADISRVLGASTVEGEAVPAWLASPDPRPARKACLLNLLASLRVAPGKADPMLGDVLEILSVFNDRIYVKVGSGLKNRIDSLVKDPKKPFFAEGPPTAKIHQKLLEVIPAAESGRFKDLLSFRGEGRPSLQMVIAVPAVGLPHTYAEFDLDLANPLQDIVGFLFHVGELLDGKETNHMDLRKKLAEGKAGEFLYYKVA